MRGGLEIFWKMIIRGRQIEHMVINSNSNSKNDNQWGGGTIMYGAQEYKKYRKVSGWADISMFSPI